MKQNNKIRMPEEFTDMDSKETMLTGGWHTAGCTQDQFDKARTFQFDSNWEIFHRERSQRKATALHNISSDITDSNITDSNITDSIATKAAVTIGILTIIGTVVFVSVEATK